MQVEQETTGRGEQDTEGTEQRQPAQLQPDAQAAAAAAAPSPSSSSAISTHLASADPAIPLQSTWSFFFDDGNFEASKRTQTQSMSSDSGSNPTPTPPAAVSASVSASASVTAAAATSSSPFMRHLVHLGSFHSIQSFWSYFNTVDLSIQQICRHGRFNLRLFKEGCTPGWEPSADASTGSSSVAPPGGKWVLKSTPSSDLVQTRAVWFEMLLALVGEQLPLAHTVTGCILVCRPHRNEVQLWVNQAPYQALPVIPSSPQEEQRRRAALAAATAAAAASSTSSGVDGSRGGDGGVVPSAAAQLALVSQQSHDIKLRAIATTMRRLLRLADGVRISYIPHSYELEKARTAETDHGSTKHSSKHSSSTSSSTSSSSSRNQHATSSSSSSSRLHRADPAAASSSSAVAVASVSSAVPSSSPQQQQQQQRQQQRDLEQSDRARVRSVHSKTSKAQTWPIRPPESDGHTIAAGSTVPAAMNPSAAASPASTAASLTLSSPSGSAAATALPSPVDPNLLAALSLSANPLHEFEPAATGNSCSAAAMAAVAPDTIPASTLLAVPPTAYSNDATLTASLSPHLLQRFLISKHSPESPSIAGGDSSAAFTSPLMVRELGAPMPLLSTPSYGSNHVSPNSAATLHGPLASLLGLAAVTPPSSRVTPPTSANGYGGPAQLQQQQRQITPPRSSRPLGASQVPTHAGLLATPSGFATAAMAAPLLPSPGAVSAAALTPPSTVRSVSIMQPGVHVLNSAGRPSAISSGGAVTAALLGESVSAAVPVPVSAQSVQSAQSTQSTHLLTLPVHGRMSKQEKQQAQKWLDRVTAKQEQAKSWPHTSPATNIAGTNQPQHQQHHQQQQQRGSALASQNANLQLAHVHHRGPNNIPLIPLPGSSSLLMGGGGSTNSTVSASGSSNSSNSSSARVSPRLGEFVRARTDATTPTSATAAAARKSRQGSLSKPTTAPTAAATVVASQTSTVTAAENQPAVAPSDAPLAAPFSPSTLSAAAIFSMGSLPVLQLTECVVRSSDDAEDELTPSQDGSATAAASSSSSTSTTASSSSRSQPSTGQKHSRSRSLFFTGNYGCSSGGVKSGSASPFAAPGGMLISPLLTAFKDASEVAAKEAALLARGKNVGGGTIAAALAMTNSSSRPVLVSSSDSPPMMHLPSPMQPRRLSLPPTAATSSSSAPTTGTAAAAASKQFDILVSPASQPRRRIKVGAPVPASIAAPTAPTATTASAALSSSDDEEDDDDDDDDDDEDEEDEETDDEDDVAPQASPLSAVAAAPLAPQVSPASSSEGHAELPSEDDDAVITPSASRSITNGGGAPASSSASSTSSFMLYPLVSDSGEWERTTRLESGLPPLPAAYAGSSGVFKPMSRAERKAALAMLSKVSNKRMKAQSWPRSMLSQPGAEFAAASSNQATPAAAGAGLSPLPSGGCSPTIPLSGTASPRPPSRGGGGQPKPSAASHLSIDVRATTVASSSRSSAEAHTASGGGGGGGALSGPASATASSSLLLGLQPSSTGSPGTLVQSRRINPFGSPNPLASPSTPLRPVSTEPNHLQFQQHQPQSQQQQHQSGNNTPSGTSTPGGRVTLGMGLRSRTKSFIVLANAAAAAASGSAQATPPQLGRQGSSATGRITPIGQPSGSPSPTMAPISESSSGTSNNSSSSNSCSAPPLAVGSFAVAAAVAAAAAAGAVPLASSTAVAPLLASPSSAIPADVVSLQRRLISSSSSLSSSVPLTRISPPQAIVPRSLGATPLSSSSHARAKSSMGSPSFQTRSALLSSEDRTSTALQQANLSPTPTAASSATSSFPPSSNSSTRPLYAIILLLTLLLIVLTALLLHTRQDARMQGEMQINMLRQEIAAARAAVAAAAKATAQQTQLSAD